MWGGDPHFGAPGYMRGEHKRKKPKSPTGVGTSPTNRRRRRNSTQLKVRRRRKWRSPVTGRVSRCGGPPSVGGLPVPYPSGRFNVVPRAASRRLCARLAMGDLLGGLLPVPGRLQRQRHAGVQSPLARAVAWRFDATSSLRPWATSDGLCGELASG